MSDLIGTTAERHARLALAGLVLGAFLLRLPGLAGDAPWIDESASIGLGSLPWGVVFGEMARVEASPPGYYAIAGLIGRLVGPAPEPLRLLSAATAALAVVPVFLACRAAFGLRAAWVAACVVALHASLIRHGQDGRTYALLFLLSCCALLAALRLVLAARDGRRGTGAVLALGLLQGAMLWLHHTAAIANLALNLFVLVALVAGGGRVVPGLARLAAADALGLAVGAAPILWALGHATDGAFITRWIAPPGLVDVALIYVRDLVAPFHSPLSVLTLALTAAGLALAVLARAPAGRPERWGFAALLAFAGLAFPLVSQRWPVLVDRTVLFLVAPIAAGAAAGLALLPRRAFLATAALLLALHGFGALRFHLLPMTREGWNEVATLLAERMVPEDRIVVTDSVFALLSLRAAVARGGAAIDALLVPATSPLEWRSAELLAPDAAVAVDALCPRLLGAGAAWIVARPAPPPVAEDPAFATWPAVRAALARAGGERLEALARGGILVERWRPPAAC
jgi:hypothetical protein